MNPAGRGFDIESTADRGVIANVWINIDLQEPRFPNYKIDFDEAEANAKRICVAVNMHDSLIECIKDLMDRVQLDMGETNPRVIKANELLKQAEQY